jgi:hypothetical protein
MNPTPRPNDLVIILGADIQDARAICQIIEEGPYRAAICADLAELKSMLAAPCLAAILDVDSVSLDDRTIRSLTLAFPSTRFLCTSRDRFHPELQESIRDHLFACLNKPVDPEELHYFLRCIRDNQAESPDLPPHEHA